MAGKLAFVATVIAYLRPFLAAFWRLSWGDARGAAGPGPPASERPGSCDAHAARGGGGRRPRDLVHTKRAVPSLLWVRAFLKGGAPLLQSLFPCSGEPPPDYRIQVDASPWGMGGVLLCARSGRVLGFFAVGITSGNCTAL